MLGIVVEGLGRVRRSFWGTFPKVFLLGDVRVWPWILANPSFYHQAESLPVVGIQDFYFTILRWYDGKVMVQSRSEKTPSLSPLKLNLV